ncbi:uncharacterized protein LOC144107835 isoform X2 [Amblyomma americanum]
MLRSVVLISLLGLCLALEVTIERRKEHLFVNGAPNGSVVQLLKLDPRASSCAESHGADVILEEHITDEGEPFSLPVDLLSPGKYCAVVVSPSGNHTSQWPAEIKADSAVMGNGLGSQPQCSSWNATVIIEASYTKRTVDASVNVFENSPPGCDYLRVGLWNASTQDQPCDNGNLITLVRTETEHQADSPVHLEFQNLSAGIYYCVRVRVIPECNPYGECITLMSKVIELPSAEPKGSWRRPEANQSRLLWLLLLPLLLITAAVIALSVLRARRQAWAGKPFTLPSQLPVYRKSRQNPGPPVVNVVYSRDSEPHVAAVSQLCSLLESELGMRVEWDEAAVGPAHVTHDWAMAMAQLPCPTFNPAAVKAAGRGAPEMLLVLESDGALLKHQAYRQHKDLGAVSESNIDELYHTTYAALLSNQAQALGDYCHIVVARLPYTTLPSRLDLVPENRYLLPQHLRQLLAKLLHGTSLPESRADAVLSSDACRRFEDALANACNACDERGFAADSVCGKLQAILRES